MNGSPRIKPSTEYDSPERPQFLIYPTAIPVSGLHSEQQVYNKTADPPPQGVSNNNQGQQKGFAGLLQTTTTSDGWLMKHGEYAQGRTHHQQPHPEDVEYWAQVSRSNDDPTTTSIDGLFMFKAENAHDSENRLNPEDLVET